MSFLHKYSPVTIADVVFNDVPTKRRVEQYASGQRTGNIIFHGPKGTAKSTTARIITRELARTVDSGYPAPVLQSSNITNDTLEGFWAHWNWQIFEGIEHPFIILEEVDQISIRLQHKLRSVLDECNKGKVILTTNNIHTVDVPLVDRCDDIEMPLANTDMWFDRARWILENEKVRFSDEQLRSLLRTCNGSIRDLMRALEDFALERK